MREQAEQAYRGSDVGVSVAVSSHPGSEGEGPRIDGQLTPGVLLQGCAQLP